MVRRARRWLASLVWIALALGAVAGPASAQADIEGRWVVQCMQPSDDCPTFTVTFGADGGITDLDLWGSQSPRRGRGAIASGVLDIDIGIFAFTGALEGSPAGAARTGSLVARGIVRDLDLDGDRFESPAVATRLCCDRLTGKAHGLGRGSGRAGIGIAGAFVLARPIDLRTATLSLTKLLDDGASDVSGLPLDLVADPRNSATTAYFRTAPGATPAATVSIRDRGRGEFAVRIEVSRATAAPSARCPGPNLSTAFVIDGLTISRQQPWVCFGTRDQYLNAKP